MRSKKAIFWSQGLLLIAILAFFLPSAYATWQNASYSARYPINTSNATISTAIMIGGALGFIIPGTADRQLIWIRSQPNLYLYYNPGIETSIQIWNATAPIPYEVELGNMTSSSPTSVWSGWQAVWHMANNPANSSQTLDSSGNGNYGEKGTPSSELEYFDQTNDMCMGKCQYFMGGQKYIRSANAITPTINISEQWQIMGIAKINGTLASNDMVSIGATNPAGNTRADIYAVRSQSAFHYYFGPNIVTDGYDGTTTQAKDQTADLFTLSNNLGVTFMTYNTTLLTNHSGSPILPGVSTYLVAGDAANWGGVDYPFIGLVDEVRIRNTIMSMAEINAIYYNYKSFSGYGSLGTNESYQPITLTFQSQTPSNLTSLNFINKEVNLSFTYSNGLNLSQGITLYYKTNYTNSDKALFVNGSWISGFSSISCVNLTQTNIFCQLDDNDILPASYSIPEILMENSPHVVLATLSTTSQWWKYGTHNLSSTYPYGWFEFMVMGSTSTSMPVLFCNSSYVSGQPSADPNCAQIASAPGNDPYNHTHAYSGHKIIPFGIDANGNINGVKVTKTGYFLFRGSSASPVVYGVTLPSDPTMEQISSNNGNTWSNNAGVTSDMHIHQLTNYTTFYYYACDITGLCSATQTDILEQDKLPPTTPQLYDIPSVIERYSTIAVNWTSAVDPNEQQVSYNLSLYNSTAEYYGLNWLTALTTYSLNFTQPSGIYSLSIQANNTAGLKSGIAYSNSFVLCSVNYSCTHYLSCSINNILQCSNVTDIGCGYPFSGNLSSYNQACVYIAQPTSLQNIDLSTQTNVILFGIFLFFWIGLGVLAFTFRSFIYGSMMFIAGLLLGFWSFGISWILGAMFFFFSALFFMQIAKFK